MSISLEKYALAIQNYYMAKRKLSVFIDESGDLGEYNEVTEFYVISFVFHDQSNDISNQIEKLTNSMK